MAQIQFGTATRRKARLRLGIMGPSGSGKSWGALEVAAGLAPMDKVFVVDTERGSASLYADKGGFQVCELTDDFSPATYTAAIKAAEGAGAEVIILDSLSHAWEGVGGALDMVEAATARSKSGNSYTAWKEVTPAHRALVDAILQSPAHIIATLRVKTEYVIEKDERGKSMPRKVGLAPIQRAGLEYEFSVFLDLNDAHMATPSKDRTGLFDGKVFQLGRDTGAKLKAWLESGAEPKPMPAPSPVADVAAAADVLAPYASKLQACTTLDDLKLEWDRVPSALKAGLTTMKDEIKNHLKGGN